MLTLHVIIQQTQWDFSIISLCYLYLYCTGFVFYIHLLSPVFFFLSTLLLHSYFQQVMLLHWFILYVLTQIKTSFLLLCLRPPELMCCEELHAVLHLVLQAGNLLNAVSRKKNIVQHQWIIRWGRKKWIDGGRRKRNTRRKKRQQKAF